MRSHAKASSAGPIDRTGKLAISLLLAIAAFLAFASAPALASQTHIFQSSVGSGELFGPAGLAVDDANGNLYASEPIFGTVAKYDSSGAPANFSGLGSNQLPVSTTDVAVDNSAGPNAGHIYATVPGAVQAFDAAGEPADFSASAPYIEGNKLGGTPAGPLSSTNGVAVDANGCIYLSGLEVIDVFAPSGEFLTDFPVGNTGGLIAVDSVGNVYFTQKGGPVTLFAPSSFPVSATTTYSSSSVTTVVPYGLAVDPLTDDLYVDGRGFIGQYDSAANGNGPIALFGSEQLGGDSNGVTIDRSPGADGSVYVSASGRVDRFGPLVTLPDATTNSASDIQLNGDATLNGEVDANEIELSECRFEYGESAAYGESVPCAESAAEIGSGDSAVPVHADLSGLALGDHHFRLVTANLNGTGAGADRTLAIVKAPTVLSQSAAPSFSEAKLLAKIDPGNAATTYRFEYGSTAAYGHTTASATIPAGLGGIGVSATVMGLSPQSVYHFRVLATNSVDTEVGTDQTFTTAAGPGVDSCSNAAFRSQQQSAFLPDCRAYEQVSPVDKGGIDVNDGITAGILTTPQAAGQGGAILYGVLGAFPGASASIIQTHEIGIRQGDPTAWDRIAVSPPLGNVPSENNSANVSASSADLSLTVVGSTKALAPGAVFGQGNLYLRDNATGTYELIATSADPAWKSGVTAGGTLAFGNASFSAVQIGIANSIELVPGLSANGLYKWTRATGELELASTAPNGEPLGGVHYIHPTTEDGSTTFYSDTGVRGAYMHRSGEPAVPLSVSQRAGDPATVQSAKLLAVTKDGSFAFFESTAPLTEDATANPLASDLYRYETATGTLIDMTTEDPSGGGISVSGFSQGPVIGVSQDGDRAYFFAEGVLAPGAEPGTNNLYEWNFGSSPTLIAADVGNGYQDQRRMSSNTRYITFRSDRSLTGYDNKSESCAPAGFVGVAVPCQEVYVYSDEDGLWCASCVAGGGESSGNATLGGNPGNSMLGDYEPRALLNDGSVFFNTSSALVAQDTNRKQDVYRYRNGSIELISSGRSSSRSVFADASADGTDVYLYTRERLVGQDEDEQIDVYDARVDGGLASQYPQPTASCNGEGCRDESAPPPPGALPASVGLVGPANKKPTRHRKPRCGKARKGVAHCAKHKHWAKKKHHAKGHAAKKGRH